MSVTVKFPEGRKLKIMQITDAHSIKKADKDTRRLLEGVLDKVKPDLVVFTGDQVKGYGLSDMVGDKKENVKKTINNTVEPVAKRNIPFTATMGNHDPTAGPIDEQMRLYESYPTWIANERAFDCSTFSVPVLSSDGSRNALNLYLIDTHSRNESVGYDPVSEEQVSWLRNTRDALAAENGGKNVPGFVFQHIPVAEAYDVLKQVDKGTKDAVKAYRIHKGEFYVVGEGTTGLLREQPSISDINNGEFDIIAEKGDILGVYFGHDHTNTFVGKLRGVDIGYAPGCGFDEYGDGADRGVRVFEIDENDPANYETYVITYREMFGDKVLRPVKNAFYQYVPRSVDAAIPMIAKLLGVIAAVVIVIILIKKYL